MLNKVCVSIIKRASHGSGGWIKSSCSGSIRLCKKNVHISNVIITFLSLLVSVVRGRREGRMRFWEMLVSRVCLQEQKKQSFLSLLKSSDIFLYKSSVCTSNSWPAFCFILSLRSSLITQRVCPTSSAGKTSVYDSAYCVWNVDIFLTKCMDSDFIWHLVDCWTETPTDASDKAWNSQENI